MGGPTALLSRCLGSMDLLQGMGSAAAIGARGAHLAARDDPEKAPIGFLSFAGADSGKRHPDPICQWYSNVLCTSLLVLPLVAKEQRLGTSVHVLLSKSSDNSRISGENRESPSRENRVVRGMACFYSPVSSSHELFPSRASKGKKKGLDPKPGGDCSHLKKTGQSPTHSQRPKHGDEDFE